MIICLLAKNESRAETGQGASRFKAAGKPIGTKHWLSRGALNLGIQTMSRLAKHIHILQSIRTYKISEIRFDLIAGKVFAGSIIPE